VGESSGNNTERSESLPHAVRGGGGVGKVRPKMAQVGISAIVYPCDGKGSFGGPQVARTLGFVSIHRLDGPECVCTQASSRDVFSFSAQPVGAEMPEYFPGRISSGEQANRHWACRLALSVKQGSFAMKPIARDKRARDEHLAQQNFGPKSR